MKTLFRLLVPITALALLAGAGSARAEETTPAPADTTVTTPAAKGNKRDKRAQAAGDNERQVLKELNLIKDQKTKIAGIKKKEAADLKAVSGDTALAAKEKRSKATAIRESSRAEIRALLTAEQKEKFDKAAANADKTAERKKGGKRNR